MRSLRGVAMSTMPAQKPGRSVQEVVTPRELLDAVEERFGYIGCDLAASDDNAVCHWYYGLDNGLDALDEQRDWAADDGYKLSWLNPPYGKIAPWAAKCVEQSALDARIAMLVPAAVGSNWFNQYVRPYAYVLELTPRVTFVGHSHPYPKDLILAYYCPERFIGREAWYWRKPPTPANDNAVDPRQMTLPILGEDPP